MSGIRRAVQGCFGLSALCFLAIAAQFFRLASEAAPVGIRTVEETGVGQPPAALRQLPSEGTLKQLIQSVNGADSKAPGGDSRPLQALLYVTADVGRLEVYVDGRRVGLTPYMGKRDCIPGQSVKIELLPPKGPPLRRDMPCTPEIRVSAGSQP